MALDWGCNAFTHNKNKTAGSAAAVSSPCVATGRFLHRPGVLPDKSLFAFFSLIPVPGFMRLSFVWLVLEVLVLALSLPFLDPDFLNHPETKFTRTWQSLPLIMTSKPLHLEGGSLWPTAVLTITGPCPRNTEWGRRHMHDTRGHPLNRPFAVVKKTILGL